MGSRGRGAVVALPVFVQCIIAINFNMVFIALPRIGAGLGFSGQTLQWIVSAYALTFGGFLLLGARAAELLGGRRMFVLGLSLYALSSLAGGLSPGPGVLVAARTIQGVGGAFLAPATLSLVTTTLAEERERNYTLAIWCGASGGGLVLGSLLGGVLTQLFGWQAVFFANVPLAAGAALLAFRLIPADTTSVPDRRLDLTGALTATIGFTSLVFALVEGPDTGWASAVSIVAMLIAVVLIASFVVIEGSCADPLMPLRLFANRNLGIGTVLTALFMATFGALAYFFTIYFQTVLGYSSLQTGLAFLVPCVCVLAGTALGGRMATWFGIRTTLLLSLAVGAIGVIVLSFTLAPNEPYAVLVPSLILLSVGQGVVFTAMFTAATTGAAAAERGVALAVATTGQQVGGAIGLAILVAVANLIRNRTLGAPQVAITDAARAAVEVIAVGIVLTALIALAFLRAQRMQQTRPVLDAANQQ